MAVAGDAGGVVLKSPSGGSGGRLQLVVAQRAHVEACRPFGAVGESIVAPLHRAMMAAVSSSRLPWALSGLALCAWCGWVSGFHRATAPARVTWAISLTVVAIVDVLLWRGRLGVRPAPHVPRVSARWPPPGTTTGAVLAGVAPWAALAMVAVAWDVLGLDTGKHVAHLTISALTEAFRPLNAAMLLVWMAAGIGYGRARARAPVGADQPPPTVAPGTGAAGIWWAAVALSASTWGDRVPAAAPALLLPDNRAIGVAFWLGVVVVGVGIDLLARRSAGRLANAEQLVRFVTAPMAANVVVVGAWTYAGYHLFAH